MKQWLKLEINNVKDKIHPQQFGHVMIPYKNKGIIIFGDSKE